MKLEQVEKLPDRTTLLRRVTHLGLWVDGVVVTSADAYPLDVAGFNEVYDDPLSRPLRDLDVPGKVLQPDVRVLCDAQKHLGMVRQECPRRIFLSS